MSKKIFYQISIGLTLLMLLALAPGSVIEVKAQDGLLMPRNDERTVPESVAMLRARNVSATWNDTVVLKDASPASVGTGKYDDTDAEWDYNGNWTAFTISGPYNDTLHYSSTLNDFALLEFEGPQFKLTFTGNFNRGNMDVYVDDVKVGTINQYSPSSTWQKTWTSPIFTDAVHNLKLVHASGTYVGIDAIEILQVTPLGFGIYDDTHAEWGYSGNWTAATASGPYNNTFHYSASLNDFAMLAFEGPQFKLIYASNFNRGNVDVYVDDVKVGTINQYSSSLTWQNTWISPTFTNDIHFLKLVHVNGTYAGIDAIEIVPPLSTGKYDDTNHKWFYNGKWTAYTTSGPYNNTLHYSAAINDYAALLFEGYQLKLTYTGNFNRGNMDVYVDDVKVGTVNEYSPTVAWQQTWTSPVFTDGIHTLKLAHVTGTYVGIDAIEIIGTPDTTPPAAIDDLQATPSTLYASVDLSWTAVGDDGTTGTATNYLVRYSLDDPTDPDDVPIDSEARWNKATPVITGIPTPQASGQVESMTISNLEPGETYYFAVRAQDDAAPNTSAVSTNSPSAEAFSPPPPPNDNFSNATPIGTSPYTDTNDYYYAATTELGDPEIVQCNSDRGKYSIWYTYTPTNAGILVVDTFGSNLAYDTVLAVWTHDGSTFTHIACNDDANENTFLSQAVAYLEAGTTYYVEVVQYSQPPQSSLSASSRLLTASIDEIVLNARFSPATLKGIGKHDDTASGWFYDGNWTAATISGPYNNTLHYSTSLNDLALLAFEGSQFKVTYTSNFNRGNVDVYVDNVKVGTINQYSSSLAWQKTWTSPVFVNGVHTVKFVHVSGAYAGVDAIEIINISLLSTGKYDDTLSNWFYSGSWTAFSTTGPYNNTLHYSTGVDDFAMLAFEGTQFIVTYTGNFNRGNMDVYVDNIKVGTINQFSSTLTWQKTWTSPTFSNGGHTLKLVHTTGAFVGVDAIEIIGAPDTIPPASIDDLQATAGSFGGTVDLSWTAVGDNGTTGTASAYLVRYGTSPIINSTAWNSATEVDTGIPTPKASGQTETMTIFGLSSSQTYYFAVRAQDEVPIPNVGAVSTNSPSAQPDPVTPLGIGKHDDTDGAWFYNGSWTAFTTSGPYNNSLHYSTTLNNYALLAFQGTQFRLTYTGNFNRGNVDVYVDDIKVGTIDQYSSSVTWQKIWVSPAFSDGIHVLKLVHASGAYAGVDAIEILSPLPASKYDDIHGRLFYSGSWAAYTTSGPYNNTLHYSTAIDDYAGLAFQGTQLIVTYTGNFNRGNVDVYVDNVKVGTINQYSSTLTWQKTWTSPIFTNGAHALKLVHATGAYAGVDAIEVIGP